MAIKKNGCGGWTDWECGLRRRAWQPTPVLLPGESPWTEQPGGLQSMGSQESDTTEWLSTAQAHRHREHVASKGEGWEGEIDWEFGVKVKWSEVTQSCPTLCDPMDYSLPGFSVHGILQARILEWVTISFSRGSSQPRDQSQVSHIAGRCFNLWATREAGSLGLGDANYYIYRG